MMPRPAHPTPGMGPPASTHSTPSSARRTTSSSVGVPPARMRSSTVGTCVPPGCSAVESDLGSQPICMTVWPRPARAAARLQVVVDFPMPPLPYIASRYIASPFPLNTQKRAGRPPAFPPALYDCKACVRRPLYGGAPGEMHLCCNPHVWPQATVYGLVRFVRCKRHVAHAGLFARRLFAG